MGTKVSCQSRQPDLPQHDEAARPPGNLRGSPRFCPRGRKHRERRRGNYPHHVEMPLGSQPERTAQPRRDRAATPVVSQSRPHPLDPSRLSRWRRYGQPHRHVGPLLSQQHDCLREMHRHAGRAFLRTLSDGRGAPRPTYPRRSSLLSPAASDGNSCFRRRGATLACHLRQFPRYQRSCPDAHIRRCTKRPNGSPPIAASLSWL